MIAVAQPPAWFVSRKRNRPHQLANLGQTAEEESPAPSPCPEVLGVHVELVRTGVQRCTSRPTRRGLARERIHDGDSERSAGDRLAAPGASPGVVLIEDRGNADAHDLAAAELRRRHGSDCSRGGRWPAAATAGEPTTLPRRRPRSVRSWPGDPRPASTRVGTPFPRSAGASSSSRRGAAASPLAPSVSGRSRLAIERHTKDTPLRRIPPRSGMPRAATSASPTVWWGMVRSTSCSSADGCCRP